MTVRANNDDARGSERVTVHADVDGRNVIVDVDPDDSALTVVRDTLGITGPKLGCGHGACGACTMLLDDTPVATCILPATSLERRRLRTVQALSEPLHPMQRAFMAEDALQCGYCTPGFVTEAIAFFDRWRREHGHARPDRSTIADALAGHLCRCGAYEGIYRAVASACAGEHDDKDPVAPRHDARAKVTGAARFTIDQKLEGQLEGCVIRSPHAHARVVRVDLEAALLVPGVRAAVVLTPEGRLVRYAGQEVAAVAAVDARAASEGARAVGIEYEVLPAVVTVDDALAPGAEVVYPGVFEKLEAQNALEGPLIPTWWNGNMRGPFNYLSWCPGAARSTVNAARQPESNDTLAEGRFQTQTQCHTALEPHACVASWSDDGAKLTVHVSTQAVWRMANDIAKRWDLDPANVTVLAEYVGGAFGAKTEVLSETIAAVELARNAKAPVRVALERREELTVGGSRPCVQSDFAMVASAGGDLTAMALDAHASAGVAVGSTTSAVFRVTYRHGAKALTEWDVTTHAPPGKPFRGPGGPPAYWVLEQAIDEIATKRGEDPIALRRRWDDNPPRHKLYDWVESLPIWKARGPIAADRGRYRRGIGVAAATWICFADADTQVEVGAGREGVWVSSACQDMGNGTRSMLADVVSNVVGVPSREITVRIGDSRATRGPMSVGSRTTSSLAPAAETAATDLSLALRAFVVERYGSSDVQVSPEGYLVAGKLVPWSELWREFPTRSFVAKRPADEGGFLLPFAIESMMLSKYLSGSVLVAHVEVDTRLGRTRVLEVWGGYGVGRIRSPVLARSQVEGGIVQGIGYALYEERRLDRRTGRLLTAGLEDYRIAGLGDAPEIHVHFDESGFEHVAGRQVGLGELATLAPAASISNAIHHATGWRPRALPIRPDRVLEGLSR